MDDFQGGVTYIHICSCQNDCISVGDFQGGVTYICAASKTTVSVLVISSFSKFGIWQNIEYLTKVCEEKLPYFAKYHEKARFLFDFYVHIQSVPLFPTKNLCTVH